MAAEPITTEAIALTEKKMGMSLDDIIKMSKTTSTKGKQQQRTLNKSQKSNVVKDNAQKVRQYMDSRSTVRQGALAKRRSNFQGNQFPLATEVARKSAVAPIRGKAFNTRRVANFHKSSCGFVCYMCWVDAVVVHKRVSNRGFIPKTPKQLEYQDHERNAAPKQRPQTLDSMFANMKEQRMRRAFTQQNNNSMQRLGGGGGGGSRPRVPWARGRFGY